MSTPPTAQTVFWHRELPPLESEPVGAHTIEAASGHVSSRLAYCGELWQHCQHDLVARAEDRLEQEVRRLGGRYAHVLDESIEAKHNDATDEAWLQGRYTFVLYR